jgi:hypothetical protein
MVTNKSVFHINCKSLRFLHLGHYFIEPGDYQDAPLREILYFVWSVGLMRGWNRGRCRTDHWWLWCKDQSSPNPSFMHSLGHKRVCCTRPSWWLRKWSTGGIMTNSGKCKCSGKNLPQCYCVHNKSQMDCPGTKTGPLQWEDSNQPLEQWQGPTHWPTLLGPIRSTWVSPELVLQYVSCF